jgi:hypothetical protein
MPTLRRTARFGVTVFVALVLLWIALVSFESGGARPVRGINISSNEAPATQPGPPTTKNQNDQGKCNQGKPPGSPNCKPSG